MALALSVDGCMRGDARDPAKPDRAGGSNCRNSPGLSMIEIMMCRIVTVHPIAVHSLLDLPGRVIGCSGRPHVPRAAILRGTGYQSGVQVTYSVILGLIRASGQTQVGSYANVSAQLSPESAPFPDTLTYRLSPSGHSSAGRRECATI